MDTSKLIKVSLAGALAAASLAVVAYAGMPRGAASTAASDPGDTPSAVAARPASGPDEGIKVHGRWVIEVTNPDGSLVVRREFENALVGGAHLSALLARSTSIGRWGIELKSSEGGVGSTEAQPCGSTAGPFGLTAHHPCFIAEVGTGSTASQSYFETLTITAPAAGQPNAGSFVLSGTATARADASIQRVNTSVLLCAATTAPATSCDAGTSNGRVGFTAKVLDTAVPVTNGQQIQVTVVISFQ